MIRPDPQALLEAVRELARAFAADPAFAAEAARARRQFFRGEPDYASDAAAAEARFQEWLLLQRESERLGGVPLRVWPQVPAAIREALEDSVCGIFVVVAGGAEPRLRELQSGEVLVIAGPDDLRPGDLLVGRLYPGGFDGLEPSPAMAVTRDGGVLAAALQADLGRAELDRRLDQADLEALLFRRAGEMADVWERRESPEQLEARLDAVLRAGGHTGSSVTAISAALRGAVAGPGAVVTPVLEQLAFDTRVDLDAARRILLQLWNEHRLRQLEQAARGTPGSPDPSPPAAGLGATLADRIERGLRNGEDVEGLFDAVEAMLDDADSDAESDAGAEPAADLDDDADAAVAADGDLELLIQEFLWERQLAGDDARARVLAAFAAEQRAAPVPQVYLEAVAGRDLSRFLLRVYLQTPPEDRARRVRAAYDALAEFFAWAIETQQYRLAPALEACRSEFVADVDRVGAASLLLSTGGLAVSSRPRLFRVLAIDGSEIRIGAEAGEPVWLPAGEAAARLRVGDWVLGPLEPGAPPRWRGVVVVLPAAAGELLE